MGRRLAVHGLVAFALSSCAFFKVAPSSLKGPAPEPVELRLADDLTLRSGRPVDTIIFGSAHHFFPASFRVEGAGKVAYIDPLAVEDAKPADAILITHGHGDHLSEADIAKVAGPHTVVVCPRAAASALARYSPRVVKPGDKLEIGDLVVEAVPAYNLKPAFLWMVAHPRSDENVGYVLTIEGRRIYHAGDTAHVTELEGLRDIDVALVTIGGQPRDVMDAAAASALVKAIKPRIAVPMHYELGLGLAEDFAKRVGEQARVEKLRE